MKHFDDLTAIDCPLRHDKSGVAATVRPYIAYGGWWLAKGRVVDLRGFASFAPGTCDWKDSLVMRPGYEGE